MDYRDSRRRIYRKEGGETSWIRIHRFCCKTCGRYHNELPDCIAPYKHYATEVIEGVLDEIVTPDDADSEDYPSEQTITRWKEWFEMNKANMEGHLRNIAYSILNMGKDILSLEGSLLAAIRKNRQNWLESVLRLIYNSGGFLAPIPW